MSHAVETSEQSSESSPPLRVKITPASGARERRYGAHNAGGTGTAKGRFAARRESLTIEGELVAKSTGIDSPFAVGERVLHQKFRNGNTLIDGNKLLLAR